MISMISYSEGLSPAKGTKSYFSVILYILLVSI